MNQRPELETRRAMLTQMRDNFRAQGFEAEMNVAAIRVQAADSDEAKAERDKMIDTYETKSANCYRSAEELSTQLSKLPKPKKDKT